MRLCVFCGSSPGRSAAYTASARRLGSLFARRGIGLVYGGGNVGLMGVVADAVLAEGGEAIGVIPRALVDRELAHARLSELVVVDSMHERKQHMHDRADGFIALPGGFGTLDELFEALTWAQLGMHGKPCGLLDVDGFWEPLLALVQRQVAEEFVRSHHAMMLLHNNDPEALLDAFASYRAPEVTKWIGRRDA
ncbi:MAG: LOG family protein [Polyangia bacterium]